MSTTARASSRRASMRDRDRRAAAGDDRRRSIAIAIVACALASLTRIARALTPQTSYTDMPFPWSTTFDTDLKQAVDACVAESASGACACAAGCGNSSGYSFTGAIGTWDVSRAINMGNLFEQKTDFNADIIAWNVSGVRNMRCMFGGAFCRSGSSNGLIPNLLLTWNENKYTAAALANGAPAKMKFNQNISGWDVSSVGKCFCIPGEGGTDCPLGSGSTCGSFNRMFYGAEDFNKDLSRWNVARSSYFEGMFSGAKSLGFYARVGSWDMRNALDTRGMFAGAVQFQSDISTWSDCYLQSESGTRTVGPNTYSSGNLYMLVNASFFNYSNTCTNMTTGWMNGPPSSCHYVPGPERRRALLSTPIANTCQKAGNSVLRPYNTTALPISSLARVATQIGERDNVVYVRAKCFKVTATTSTSGYDVKMTVDFTNSSRQNIDYNPAPAMTEARRLASSGGVACPFNGPPGGGAGGAVIETAEDACFNSSTQVVMTRNSLNTTEQDFSIRFVAAGGSSSPPPNNVPIHVSVSVESITCTSSPPPSPPPPSPPPSGSTSRLTTEEKACIAVGCFVAALVLFIIFCVSRRRRADDKLRAQLGITPTGVAPAPAPAPAPQIIIVQQKPLD